MEKALLRQILLFVILVFLQVWLFNNIHLFGYATPLLYIYFLIKLPVDMNRNVVLLLSALMGLVIDVFGYTLGLNMLPMVVVGFLRYYFLKLFTPRDILEEAIPSFSVFGKLIFMQFAATITLVHHIIFYSIESLSLFDPWMLFLRIGGSFILTILLIFAFESINLDGLKK